jgi:hypothetical protein
MLIGKFVNKFCKDIPKMVLGKFQYNVTPETTQCFIFNHK